MKTYYELNPKFNGKMHCDKDGCIYLSPRLSQRVLKELFLKGNLFVNEVKR